MEIKKTVIELKDAMVNDLQRIANSIFFNPIRSIAESATSDSSFRLALGVDRLGFVKRDVP
jgi:hypothetical protein